MAIPIQTNVPLAPLTTFHIGGNAEFFVEVTTEEELHEAVVWAQERNIPITVIGGGSNLLVSDEGVQGLVIKNAIRGTQYAIEGDTVIVMVGGGQILDSLIEELVEKNIPGLENLSSIPGTVGATPIQNVGAYGVEVKDVIQSVRVYDTEEHIYTSLSRAECDFRYRNSFFKTTEGKRYIIAGVTFIFSRSTPCNIAYKDLSAYLKENTTPTLREVRDAIIAIRKEKFPDWHTIGTAGSYFKNPIVAEEVFTALSKQYPELPGFPEGDHMIKIPLGYVLDKILGLRGYREGNVGLYEKQALVLVEYGTMQGVKVTATEVTRFAEHISSRVKDALGILIEWEVNILR